MSDDKDFIASLVSRKQRLEFLLGYMIAFLQPKENFAHDEKELAKYEWLKEAINCVLNKDELFPPMPE